MTVRERAVFAALLGVLAERFSKTAHVMQQVEWENRGHCLPGACSMRCTAYRALFNEAADMLEAEMREPTQTGLFDAEVAG